MTKLRSILYFAPVFDGDSFGAAKATREKVGAINALGFEALPLTLGTRPRKRLLVAWRRLTYGLSSLRRLLASEGLRSRPAAVICRGNSGLLPVVASMVSRAPLIVEVHSAPLDEALGNRLSVFHVLFGAWSTLLQRVALASADVAAFIHPALARALGPQVRRGSILACGNGTDLTFFVPGDRGAACQQLDLDRDALVISFVGQVLESRGVEQLLQTFEHVLRQEPNSLLLIAGPVSATYQASLERRFAPLTNVMMLGKVSKEVARTVIQASSVCALTVNEQRVSPRMPLKLYDYASCGRPIAAQDGVEGYGDQVAALGIGAAVDFFEPERAAAQVVRLSREFLEREDEEPVRIRAVAETHFGWDTVLRTWLEAAGIEASAFQVRPRVVTLSQPSISET